MLARHHGRRHVADHDAEGGVGGGVVGVFAGGVFSGDELLDAEMSRVAAAEEGFCRGEKEAPVEHDVEAIRVLPIRFE